MIADETYAVDALVDLAPNVPTNNLDDGKGGGFGGGHAAPPLPQQNGNWFHELLRHNIDFTEFFSCIIAFQYPPQNPPGYPQQNQAPGAPFVYPPPAAAPGAMAYPPPPQSSQTLSEKDLLRLNEGPPPYFPQGKIQLI